MSKKLKTTDVRTVVREESAVWVAYISEPEPENLPIIVEGVDNFGGKFRLTLSTDQAEKLITGLISSVCSYHRSQK